ncbi:hypothetical protein GCM10009737_29070 [Nocardioides lentus]|uniref:Coenzyme F420:L-glutamate ligase-like domain-containing protein n=1 Tax=Nocardioides lentus TaxID=338077 RepID=A0ABP5B0Z5_9ACTN
MSGRLEVLSPGGVGEVRPGDDLATLLLDALDAEDHRLADGDVVVVTSKVVSKAEGRLQPGDRDAAIDAETVRVVARRGQLRIVRTPLGLTMAAAGVDASNLPVGQVALLPVDPDASARRLRAELAARAGVDVAVVVSDTAGRAWREGQTDLAIGAAGLVVLDDHAGRTDPYGNPLAVTAPAVADEAASAAELAGGKLTGRPFAVLRGLAHHVLPPGQDGPGARALVRPDGGDLFGFGAREAVVRALEADPAAAAPFGAPAPPGELAEAVRRVGCGEPTVGGDGSAPLLDVRPVGAPDAARARLAALAHAHGWVVRAAPAGATVRLEPLPGGP